METARQTADSAGIERADLEHSARPIYRASAHEFLHGAADLTFGGSQRGEKSGKDEGIFATGQPPPG